MHALLKQLNENLGLRYGAQEENMRNQQKCLKLQYQGLYS
jgi:hypothetical protein